MFAFKLRSCSGTTNHQDTDVDAALAIRIRSSLSLRTNMLDLEYRNSEHRGRGKKNHRAAGRRSTRHGPHGHAAWLAEDLERARERGTKVLHAKSLDLSPYLASSSESTCYSICSPYLETDNTMDLSCQKKTLATQAAMNEYTSPVTQGMRGRMTLWVSGITSTFQGCCGIGIAWKYDRRDPASGWETQAWSARHFISQPDAQCLAISRALALAEEVSKKGSPAIDGDPWHPLSHVVIFCEDQDACQRLWANDVLDERSDFLLTRTMRWQVHNLNIQDVTTSIHWVPDGQNVPGNELANIIAGRACEVDL